MPLPAPTKGRAGAPPLLSEINVTPLVDVMLVLLVIFMATAPLLASGVKVRLPQIVAAKPLDPKEPLILTIDKDGGVRLGAEIVSKEFLPQMLRDRLKDDPLRVIQIRGDKDAPYGAVAAVIGALAKEGATRIALAAEPLATPTSPPAFAP